MTPALVGTAEGCCDGSVGLDLTSSRLDLPALFTATSRRALVTSDNAGQLVEALVNPWERW
ncbi:hypothetical protein LKO27_07770 [Tessaracoccus sp. OS52]|uniref:hypothetical protein n=1 Tax=Tessaracoccus sp. OS52 TaxID=2886691 RepID=UPI001D121018|nr:hypothetical protein [Tessaracoccus sp. OS52]MCC2593305.1 hypothetical protein [Tessaracoccus sp. OS52]